MVKLIEKRDDITGEKELVIDKRTLPKKVPANIKNLNYARDLPPECNGCKFRPEDDGGNGLCPKYKADSVCIIRKDIAKLIDINGGRTLELMEAEFHNNFEKMMFFESMETDELNPEVTKRINSMTNLGKVINEIKSKRSTVEITEKKTLTEDQKQEIIRTVTLTKEDFLDES